MLLTFFNSLDRYREYGALFIRLAAASMLVYGTQDNIFSDARMLEFRDFLAARNVPAPLFAAHLSVYAQFICGILYALGAFVRPAASVMVINFIAAILIAHLDTPFQSTFPALMMLASSLFLLLHGAGKPSIDCLIERRAHESTSTLSHIGGPQTRH